MLAFHFDRNCLGTNDIKMDKYVLKKILTLYLVYVYI